VGAAAGGGRCPTEARPVNGRRSTPLRPADAG
jgi:hypothetical protein